MSHKALIAFIEQKRRNGENDETIRTLLIEKNWREDLVDAAIAGEELPDEHVDTIETTPSPSPENSALYYPSPFARINFAWDLLAERFASFALTTLICWSLFVLSIIIGAIVYAMSGGSLDQATDLMSYLSHLSTQGNKVDTAILTAFIEANWLPLMLGALTVVLIAIPTTLFNEAARLFISSQDKVMSAEDAARGTLKKLAGYAWVQLLTVLVVIGGFFLFIIPGFIAAIGLAFASTVYFTEDLHGAAALKRSWEIVSKNFFTVLGSLIFVFALASFANIIINALSPIVSNFFTSFIIYPMAYAYWVRLCKDLAAK